MEKLTEYSLLIFTEDKVGMLNRVSLIFTRRKLNIESITASKTEFEDVYRYTIILTTSENMIRNVVKQLEKQIEVIKAFYYTVDNTVYQEIALYKLSLQIFNKDLNFENIIRKNNARVLSIEQEFIVVEKTGTKEETQDFYNVLEPYGILEFARSGRVSLSKPMKKLSEFFTEK